jgi:sigma-B regulation protein RsbU (phosphoserine phosphatase)
MADDQQPGEPGARAEDEPRLVDELQRISDGIVAGDDLQATLVRVLEVMCAATGAGRCSIMLRSGGRLRIRAAQGLPDHVVERTAVPLGEGIAGEVALSGTARLLGDAAAVRGAGASAMGYAGASALCVPLRARGESIGVVNLSNKRSADPREPAEFDEADLRAASLLANQAGLAIGAAEAAEQRAEHERLQANLASLEEQVVSSEAQSGALAVIQQVTDSLVSVGSLEEILDGIVRHTTRLLGCRRGSLLLRDPGSRLMRMQAAVGIPEKVRRKSRAELGRGLAGRCAETGEPVLVTDVEAIRPEVPGLEARADDAYRGRSAICVPLRLRGEVLGVLNLNDRADGKDLSQRDLFVAQIVANQAAVAIWNAQLRDQAVAAAEAHQALAVARDIQQSLLPEDVSGGELALAARSIACAGAGGDYVDFWRLPPNGGGGSDAWALVIGDVSGHGVGPALVMATTRAFLRGLLSRSRDLSTVLAQLNGLLSRDVRQGRFVTLFVAVVEPRAGTLRYASAGHDPPLHRRAADGAIVELPATGPPLAILPDAAWPSETVAIAPGDWLILTTDGAWELRNEAGEAFGRERLAKAVDRLAAESPPGMLAGLSRSVLGFAGPVDPADDVSLAVARIGPADSEEGA